MLSESPQPCLKGYANPQFSRGRSHLVEALWLMVQWLLISSWVPGAAHRRWLLRIFGAHIGQYVVIKPGVRVKFPWRLEVGDHTWLGEDVWIDNLAPIVIGSNCCISQGAYLCTGSHDWSQPTFDLMTTPILIEDGAWIAAQAIVGPGVTLGTGAVLALGSVATTSLAPWKVHRGNPAVPVSQRRIQPKAQVQDEPH